MGSSSGQTPAQTTQTSDPWSGVQPSLTSLYNSASNAYSSDIGYKPYEGNLQAGLDPSLQQGLGLQFNLASTEPYGNAGVNTAMNYGTNMINQGGLTEEQRGLINQMQGLGYSAGALGNQFQGTAANYGDIYSRNAGEQNPYLLAQIAGNDRRIGDQVNAAMSGAGRYGSGAHTDVMSRTLGEAANPILAQDYAQRQQTQLAALQGQAGALGGAQGAMGMQGSLYGNIGNMYGQGQNLVGQWAQLMPGLGEARYDPAQHIQDYGNFYQNRSNQDLANQVAQYNAAQARPWEQLSRYQNVLSGAGGLGGTKVTTATPYQPSTLQRITGGAIAGAGLGSAISPGFGTAVGGLGGGLLGMMG